MNLRSGLVGLALILVVGGAGYFTYRRYVLPVRECDICGRALAADHESVVRLKDGSAVHACCPRCALHYEMHKPGGIAGLLVTDAAVGERIDAQRALYVEGSDENPCFTPAEASPREPGVEYDRTFDRCLPSLIAFKEESAARTFQVAHGGRILTYAQALKSVMQR